MPTLTEQLTNGLQQAVEIGAGRFPMPILPMTRLDQWIQEHGGRGRGEGGSRASTGTSVEEELLAIAEKRATDPSIFEEEGSAPFFWLAQVSNNQLDAYHTTMDKSSLRNYAEDASAGVAFMNSHRTGTFVTDPELPLGHSLRGRFFGAQGNGVSRTEVSFYTIPNLDLNGVNTNHFIRGVRSGVLHDVSIGFHGGDYICNICGRDMMRDWDCWHIPGQSYKPLDDEGHQIDGAEEILARANIKNAHLSEVSSVYDGATPGACILKAFRMLESGDGRIKPAQVRLIEARYRIALPGAQRSWPSGPQHNDDPDEEDDTENKEKAMPAQRTTATATTPPAEAEERPTPAAPDATNPPAAEPEAVVDESITDENQEPEEAPAAEPEERTAPTTQARSEEAAPAVPSKEDVDRAVTVLVRTTLASHGFSMLASATAESTVGGMADEIRRLRRRAAGLEREASDGRLLRKALLEEALQEGVRAMGNDFNRTLYESTLSAASVEFLQQQRNDWRRMANKDLAPGRTTTDGAEEPEQETEEAATAERGREPLPIEAYRGA
jgi:hypothetical protein